MGSVSIGRILAYIFFTFFALPPIYFGGWLLLLWLRILFRPGIYLQYPYLGVGIAFLCLGLVEVLCIIQGMRRGGRWKLLLAVPVVLGLATMVNVPDVAREDREGSRHIGTLINELDSFARQHGRFPATVPELTKFGPAAASPSPYRKNGQPLRHRVVLLADATGPYSGSIGDEPGVAFYAVTHDCKEAWLTETELSRPVAGKVQFVQLLTESGYVTSFHRQVSPKWPAE